MASSDDNILSENLRGALDHAAALVAQSAGSEAPHLVDRLMVATRARFNESLARALRLRNASALCFSLPNELWVKIWSVMDTRHRLNVSHVCHGWRALAVSTPSLWASISVTCRIRAVPHTFFCSSCMDSNAIEKYITTIDLCDYLLQRTADSPLSVRVSADAVSYYPKYAEDVCELLRIHGHRIVRLEVLCPIAAFINELLDLLLPLPNLHDLIIGNAGIVLSHAEPAFEESFTSPP